jgi:hypothetical protein
MTVSVPLCWSIYGLLFLPQESSSRSSEVPVTIKELDVGQAIREFEGFQQRLGEFHGEIRESRALARETSQILEDLRQSANAANQFNEGPLLHAVQSYVATVLSKQVALVDFLESQRYRISYYASKMASSIRPEELTILFGSEADNQVAISARTRERDRIQAAIADLVDALPDDQIDRQTFRPRRAMPRSVRGRLNQLLQGYQQARSGLDLAKKRLQLVRAAERNNAMVEDTLAEVNTDLLIGQMFGALDGIRLQMSIDLMDLEHLLSRYSQSARTQEILDAFQRLVQMQGSLEGPSPELSSVLDWLQDSSTRRIAMGVQGLSAPTLQLPTSSDLLREAYLGARRSSEQRP